MFNANRYRPTTGPTMKGRQWPDQQITTAPRWVSVDLRDGNQALVEPMSVAQKQRLWELLVKVGFREIEVGFPAASQPDYDFVRWLIEGDRVPETVTIQVLVQARKDLIERTFEALRGARRATVHVYNSTSRVQRDRVFRLDQAGVREIAVQGARWVTEEAAKYPETEWCFEYSPESFTSTETDYAIEVCNAVIDVWAPSSDHPCVINLPTTVEVASPNVFADQVEYVGARLNRRDGVILSVHTHNDRGGAVASAELAMLAGAQRVEGTLLGNGERTGNMDVLTLAMNLYSQGIDPQLDLSNPDEIIQVVTECTGIALHPRHPWVGELVYTAFSGSHQDAIRKCLDTQQDGAVWDVAYLPIDPRDIGRDYQDVIRVNSQSGKGGVAFVLERDHGIRLPRWMQVELARLIQKISEKEGGVVSSEKIHEVFLEHFMNGASPSLLSYHVDQQRGQDFISVEVAAAEREITLKGTGNGVIAAFMDALEKYAGTKMHIVDYEEHALSEGSNAEAICFVQMNVNGSRYSAAAKSNDTIGASLSAVLRAFDKAKH